MTSAARRGVHRFVLVSAVLAASLLGACGGGDGGTVAASGSLPNERWAQLTLSSTDSLDAKGCYYRRLSRPIYDEGWMTVQMHPGFEPALLDPAVSVYRYYPYANKWVLVGTDNDSGPGLAALFSFQATPGVYAFDFASNVPGQTGRFDCRLQRGIVVYPASAKAPPPSER